MNLLRNRPHVSLLGLVIVGAVLVVVAPAVAQACGGSQGYSSPAYYGSWGGYPPVGYANGGYVAWPFRSFDYDFGYHGGYWNGYRSHYYGFGPWGGVTGHYYYHH